MSEHAVAGAAATADEAPLDPPSDPPGSRSWIDRADTLPASRAIGVRCLAMQPREVSMTVATSVWPLNPNGALHGGLLFAAIDHCMGVTAVTAQTPGHVAVTASLTVDYYAPAQVPVTLVARVARRARAVTFVELTAAGADGKTCARATGIWAAAPTAGELSRRSTHQSHVDESRPSRETTT